MAQYRLTPCAQSDLEEIWQYIAQDDPEIADQFLRELIERFILLSKNQFLGIRQPAFDENLRLFPYKKYLVFYFPTDFGIEVSRVLHSARDIESIFDA